MGDLTVVQSVLTELSGSIPSLQSIFGPNANKIIQPLPNPMGTTDPNGQTVQPLNPSQSSQDNSAIGSILGGPITNAKSSVSGIIDIPQLIGQFVLGLEYDIEDGIIHLLIYGFFALLFVMLIYSLVSDQTPGEIVVNGAQSAGRATRQGAELLASTAE